MTEPDDITEPIPVITAPKNRRTAPTPASLTKADGPAPSPGHAFSGMATVTASPVTAPGPGGMALPVAEPPRRGDPTQNVTAMPAQPGHGGAVAAAATEWEAAPKRRKRRSRQDRGAASFALPKELMMRPLFVEENTFEEVLATVRSESAGITPWSGMWPAAVVVAVAALILLILAAGIVLALSAHS